MVANMTPADPRYEVSLSFAGEQRAYVGDVAKHLFTRGIKVFYDRNETVKLWGKDQVEAFHQQFAKNTDYVVMFISKEIRQDSGGPGKFRGGCGQRLMLRVLNDRSIQFSSNGARASS